MDMRQNKPLRPEGVVQHLIQGWAHILSQQKVEVVDRGYAI